MPNLFRTIWAVATLTIPLLGAMTAGGCRRHAATAPVVEPSPPGFDAVHSYDDRMAAAVGRLSPAQQAKRAELEGNIRADLKQNPAKAGRPHYARNEVGAFLTLLTPPQLRALSGGLARTDADVANAITLDRLHRLGIRLAMYVAMNHDTFPPRLAMAADPAGTPDDYLAGGSATPVPANWTTMTPAARADWVDQHGDYTYTAGGMKYGKVHQPETFAVAFVKPAAAAAGRGTAVLYADGHCDVSPTPP